MTDEGCENLRAAILGQAAKDWRTAMSKGYLSKVARIEKFFLSPYGQLLSEGSGQYIINRLKEEFEYGRSEVDKADDGYVR